jgi:hypothetical protein
LRLRPIIPIWKSIFKEAIVILNRPFAFFGTA